MQWQRALPYSVPLLVITFLLIALAYYIWRRRAVPGSWALLALALGAAEWALGYALEISMVGSDAALVWARLQYIGIMSMPIAWLAFALVYSGHTRWLRRWLFAALSIVPILTNVLVWTNDWHGLIWPAVTIDNRGLAPILSFDHGPAFWACNIYSHLTLGAGTIIVLRAFLQSPRIFLSQIATMLVAVVGPWLGNIVYVLRLIPNSSLDLTPFAFSIATFAVTLGVWRYRFLKIVPTARGYLFEHLDEGILVLDLQDRIVDWNGAARAFLGVTNHAIGLAIEPLLTPWPELQAFVRQPTERQVEIPIALADGQARVYEVRISQLSIEHGAPSGRLVLWRDITERRRAEALLRQQNEALLKLQADLIRARDQAEQANRAKSSFLANMSHELRTPLTAILGYTQLMKLEMAEDASPRMVHDLDAISTAGDHLLNLISSLLDLTKIEAGKLALRVEPFSIADLAAEIGTTVQPLIERNQNQLLISCSDHIGAMLSDPVRLRQVLLNLLGNAAKFTERGTIELRVQISDLPPVEVPGNGSSQSGGPWVIFEIADTGIGIPEEQLPMLFDAFTQAGALPDRLNDGTGLGLHLSRRMCWMMGGDLAVRSKSGAGSTFTVYLPRELHVEH